MCIIRHGINQKSLQARIIATVLFIVQVLNISDLKDFNVGRTLIIIQNKRNVLVAVCS